MTCAIRALLRRIKIVADTRAKRRTKAWSGTTIVTRSPSQAKAKGDSYPDKRATLEQNQHLLRADCQDTSPQPKTRCSIESVQFVPIAIQE
jgi:hypothetical protein